ncbi:hypothetical protein D9613_001144 [Agrocybe pediades]|uniref:Uncharacterized protein n=1 Tax=Agrocybe pediades TaxID=84607 RepID=A0A8H4R1F5_9AGAR|nr:hypothetical protein D9613_001144 [Agrocybe pediades]
MLTDADKKAGKIIRYSYCTHLPLHIDMPTIEDKFLAAVDAKKMSLGLFVLNKRDPLSNHYNPFHERNLAKGDGLADSATGKVTPHDVPPVTLGLPETNVVKMVHYEAWSKNAQSGNVKLTLAKMFHATVEKSSDAHGSMKGREVKVHRMENQIEWFAKAKTNSGVRRWFQDMHNHSKKVYMVVGYSTVEGMVFKNGLGEELEGGLGVQPPLPMDPTLGLLAAPAKAEIGGTIKSKEAAAGKYKDEVVLAVQYQKLKFNFLGWRDITKAKIGVDPDRWILWNETRGGGNPDKAVEVEVLMSDSDSDSEVEMDNEDEVYDWGSDEVDEVEE